MNQLPILNYHGIDGKDKAYPWLDVEKRYVLSLKAFEAQMHRLHTENFHTFNREELQKWFDWQLLIDKPLVLTFDDGHISHYEQAMPVLKKLGLKAVFFVTAGFVGKEGYMGWDHLKQLLIHGFDIGSHGMHHIPLQGLSAAELDREIGESKKILEERLQTEISFFSIPRGFGFDGIRAQFRKSGYRFVMTSDFDVNFRNQDSLNLRRMAVRQTDSLTSVIQWCHGKVGWRRETERIKKIVRHRIPPAVYDRLSDFKRRLKTK
ncbi:polysaccharide deacetylase family protein [Omnitrophica bacterium]|nr:polysaccharide deacetylase family protein [Candidatus Omnitrophota bacterium]